MQVLKYSSFSIYLFSVVVGCVLHSAHVEVRNSPVGVGSPLPPLRS